MTQQAFALRPSNDLSYDSYIVSQANNDAFQWVKTWPDWPSHAVCIVGPKGSGKTHLTNIWQIKASARVVSVPCNANLLSQQNTILEDIESELDEEGLLHLYNATKEQGNYLWLTSALPLKKLNIKLADLRSRLYSIPSITLAEPDDELLEKVLKKYFSDRQLRVDHDVIKYLLPRIERSFVTLQQLVDTLDTASLKTGRNITIPFTRKILGYD